MATSWWVATGTRQKMENDIQREYSVEDIQAFWNKDLVTDSEHKPLYFYQVLPAFILLGIGLASSPIMFLCDILFHRCKKRSVVMQAQTSNRTIMSRLDAVESSQGSRGPTKRMEEKKNMVTLLNCG